MSLLVLEDLQESTDLDAQAYADICGGMNMGFLSQLQAFRPGSVPGNSFFFVDNSVTQNIFQQNPVNLNIGAGQDSIVAIDNINLTTVSAGSPMTFVQGAPLN